RLRRIPRKGALGGRLRLSAFTGEPFRISTRPGVLACRNCRRQTGLTVGTVMERSHTPLSTWFWAAYLVASQTQGMSAVQFQRQLGLTRYETAFQILHKLRAGMVRPHQDRIGGRANEHVEVDETWIGGRTRGEGRGVHHKVLVACAVEVRHRKPGTARDKRNDGRYAGRVRLAVAADRSAKSLCGFVDGAVAPGTLIVTDDWSGYADLRKRGYDHHAIAECGDSEVTDEFLPIIHLVFANLKTWLIGILTGSANGIYKPTSTNSRFGSTGASTRSTPSVRCSASLATQRRRPMPSFIPATGITLHLEGECVNRIGVRATTERKPPQCRVAYPIFPALSYPAEATRSNSGVNFQSLFTPSANDRYCEGFRMPALARALMQG